MEKNELHEMFKPGVIVVHKTNLKLDMVLAYYDNFGKAVCRYFLNDEFHTVTFTVEELILKSKPN